MMIASILCENKVNRYSVQPQREPMNRNRLYGNQKVFPPSLSYETKQGETLLAKPKRKKQKPRLFAPTYNMAQDDYAHWETFGSESPRRYKESDSCHFNYQPNVHNSRPWWLSIKKEVSKVSGDPDRGGIVMRGLHLIKTWSRTQDAILFSSVEVESVALGKLAIEVLGVRSMCEEWKLSDAVQVSDPYADASAALSIAKRQGAGKLRHKNVKSVWLQEKSLAAKCRSKVTHSKRSTPKAFN